MVLKMCEDYTVWRDLNFASLDIIDDGSVYQQISKLCSLVAANLIEASFSLPISYTRVLDRARTPIDLEAELYGTVGENLDFLISTNNLVGTEIFEIPRGRVVVFFV